MRDKNFNTGVRGVLLDAGHYDRMGSAIWLYSWLVLRQTHQSGSIGWVLGGSPVTYREIEEETGFNRRTLERWMRALRRHGYIETEAVPAGVIVRITKAKKFPQGARSFAGAVRKDAGDCTQTRVANPSDVERNHASTARIGSSSVEESKERSRRWTSSRDLHSGSGNGNNYKTQANPACLGQPQV